MTHWFKVKSHGFGNAPASWQGWALTVVYVASMLGTWLAFTGYHALSKSWCLATGLAVTVAFIVVVQLKSDGNWRWRRGSGTSDPAAEK